MACCPSTNCPGSPFSGACVNGTCQNPLNPGAFTCDDTICNAYCLCPDNKPEGGGSYTGGKCVVIPFFNYHECNCM